MYTKLISITKPWDKDMTPEKLIIYIARVSSGKSDEEKKEDITGLLGFLIKNNHWSPFEMVNITFEIQTSRTIAQQILRHRSFSFQEFSQRYAKAVTMEPVEMRMQADKNRQISTKPTSDYEVIVADHLTRSQYIYNELIEAGVAKETARFVLPLTTRTTLYMNGTLRSWIHYLFIRDDGHTQLEHQRIAQVIKIKLGEHFPHTWEALKWLQI